MTWPIRRLRHGFGPHIRRGPPTAVPIRQAAFVAQRKSRPFPSAFLFFFFRLLYSYIYILTFIADWYIEAAGGSFSLSLSLSLSSHLRIFFDSNYFFKRRKSSLPNTNTSARILDSRSSSRGIHS
jgi:hypothetical protein